MIQQKQSKDTNQKIKKLSGVQLKQKQSQILRQIHHKYFKDISFIQIDYIIGQPLPGMIKQSSSKQETLIFVTDQCLLITEGAFEIMYSFLLSILTDKLNNYDQNTKNSAAELLLAMNGQNEKAYNFKKNIIINLTLNQSQQLYFDVKRQLKLNSAIIMKNKKSSACYEYRFKIIQYSFKKMAKQKQIFKQQLKQIHFSEHLFAKRILDRYVRNYFCWTYRLRFFKLLIEFNNQQVYFKNQINYVFQILQKNPNDYSALSYLRYLVRQCRAFSYQQAIFSLQIKCNQLIQFSKFAYDSQQQYHRLAQFVQELKNQSQ